MAPVNALVLVPNLSHFVPLLIPEAVRVAGAILIVVLGWWVSGKAEAYALRAFEKTRLVDALLEGFFANIARYFVLTITGLFVLSQFGVQTTSLVAVVGAASLAIGLALRATLSNLAAGVMLLIFRPFHLGDHIQVGGNEGTAKNLTLFWTEIVTGANVQIIIPNSAVWGQALKNFSTYPQPAATTELRIPVPAGAELKAAKETVARILEAMPEVAKTPAPTVMLDRAADNSLQVLAKFTATAPDADMVKGEIIEAAHLALETPLPAG